MIGGDQGGGDSGPPTGDGFEAVAVREPGAGEGVDEARVAGLLASFSDHLILIADRDLRIVAAGGSAAEGVAPGQPVRSLCDAEGDRIEAACRRALAGARQVFELVDAGLVLDAAPLWRRHGEVAEIVITLRDVSALRTEQRLRRYSDRQYRVAFDRAPIAMVHVDRDGNCQAANEAMVSMLGRQRSAVEGRPLADLVHPDDRGRLRSATDAMIRGSLPWYRSEDRLMHSAGAVLLAGVTAAPVYIEGEGVVTVLFHFVDVTDQRDLEMQLRAMVDQDPLTRLHNRRSFEAALAAHSSLVARYGGQGALLLLDVDRFKQINDLYGHRAGDEVLLRLADVLRSTLRAADFVARLGGDEFVVILPDASLEEAEQVAAKLVAAVRDECRVTLGGQPRTVTTSIGVAPFAPHDANGPQLLMHADLAMYDAKNGGRNRHATYRARSGAASRPELVQRIEEGLSGNSFVLDAQRIVNLRTGAGHDHELLVRLSDESGLVAPAAFLGVAEQAGLLGRIDRWVIAAAADLLDSPRLHPAARITVNVSPGALGSHETVALLEARLADRPSLAGRLILEVPETALLARLPGAGSLGQRLGALGVRLCLDGFRGGLGTFAYLRDLPFDMVKLDGSFIRNCTVSEADRLVIRGLVDVAHGLGKQVIAAHVEDQETYDFLAGSGVDFVQGYHLGRPFPALELVG